MINQHTKDAKSRPVLFSEPMVRALIDGKKTQTRRIVKPQPELFADSSAWRWKNCSWTGGEPHCPLGTLDLPVDYCPYGKPGDLLYVRETWADVNTENGPAFAYRAGGLHFCVDDAYPVEYERYPRMQFSMWCGDLERGEPGHSWRSPLHMPRWVSRLTLELTEVRMERLKRISEMDAYAEGIDTEGNAYLAAEHGKLGGANGPAASVCAYADLWDSINGPGSWDNDPWVWVLKIKVHKCNVSQLLEAVAA